MSDDLQPIIGRYRVADADADAELARNDVRARLFGGKKKKTRIGKYVLGKLVGVGGMGRVYVAHDRELDRRVALKLLKGSQWTGAGSEEGRLWREARTLAQINHRNVVSVYEVGEASMGVYVAMEYIEGRTLRQWVNDEDPSTPEVLRVLRQAGEGLEAAHAAGIVHRDFKPDNVLIGNDGRVCVVDFGIAHDVSVVPELKFRREDYMTSTGRAALLTSGPAGTPAYMAPERLEGRDADVAGDIYSFCVSAWEALTGYLPDPYTDAPPPDPRRAVPRRLRTAVERGLDHAPQQRQPNLRVLLDAFDAELARPERSRGIWIGVGVLVAGLGAGAWLRASEVGAPAPAGAPTEATPRRPAVERPNEPLASRIGQGATPLHRHRVATKPEPGAPLPAGTVALLSGSLATPHASVASDDPAAYALLARTAFSTVRALGADPVVSLQPPRDLRPSPSEYAALASAGYDAHRGALGPSTGAKAAHPGALVVADGLGAGMPRPDVWRDAMADYLDGIRTWATAHRGGLFPADVLGLHFALRDPATGSALSPERAALHRHVDSIARWRDQHALGRELWVTRVGYEHLPLPADGDSAELSYARWSVRGALLLLAGGADRVLFDDTIRDAALATRYRQTLTRTVGDFTVAGLLEGLPDNVWVVRLSHSDGRQAVVAWTHEAPLRGVTLPVSVAAPYTVTPLDDVSEARDARARLVLDLSQTPVVAVWRPLE